MPSQMSVTKSILPNGIRVISEYVPYVESVSVGVWIIAGAVDEDSNHRGISHVMEHMLFKGTKKRSAWQIADEMDSLGGHLNAFTDREYTCFYAKILKEHLEPTVDIISDMIMNSVIDPTELEREKNVVLEEVKQHEDTPDEKVHDLLYENLWPNHVLGQSVIGTEEVISGLSRDTLLDYQMQLYSADSIIITASGNLSHRQLVELVSQRFYPQQSTRTPRLILPVPHVGSVKLYHKDLEQVQFCVGVNGFSQMDDSRYALAAIDTVLGAGMSSRLFQEIREKRGLAYSIGSYAMAYADAGIFCVYGGTNIANLSEVLDIINTEMISICNNSITEAELTRAKNQIRGALVLGQESMSNRMSRLAKNEFYFNRMPRLDDAIAAINNLTVDSVAQTASKLLSANQLTITAIGPFAGKQKLLTAALLKDVEILETNND